MSEIGIFPGLNVVGALSSDKPLLGLRGRRKTCPVAYFWWIQQVETPVHSQKIRLYGKKNNIIAYHPLSYGDDRGFSKSWSPQPHPLDKAPALGDPDRLGKFLGGDTVLCRAEPSSGWICCGCWDSDCIAFGYVKIAIENCHL